MNIEHIPWPGPDYWTRGIDGQRVVIVGYSHWLGDGDKDGDDCTLRVVANVTSGEWNIAFFNQIRNYFGFQTHRDFWNRVVFCNFLPNCVGTADERFQRGTDEQISRAQNRVLRIIFARCLAN